MKEIKSVRIRKSNVKEASLDLRLVLFDKAFGARSVKGVEANIKGFDAKDMRSISPEIEYKGSRYKDLEDDKIIEEYIKWYNKFTSAESGKEVSFQIVQDPWLVDPPLFRSFGFDPYYLNNGAELYIKWFQRDLTWENTNNLGTGETEFGLVTGVTSGTIPDIISIRNDEPIGLTDSTGATLSVGPDYGDRYIIGPFPSGPNWSNIPKWTIVSWPMIITGLDDYTPKWIKTKPEIGMTVKVTEYLSINGLFLPEERLYEYKEGPYVSVGGLNWSNESGMEMDAIKGSSFSMVTVPGGMSFPKYDTSFKDSLLKSIECFNPKTGERLMFSDQTIKKWGLDNKDYYFPGSVKDKDIISKFLEVWRTMVPSEVDLCPDTTVSKNPKCELIEYKSPIELPIEKTADQLNNESRGNLSSNKIKLNIKLPEEFIVNAREDVPKFSIWVGEPQVESIGEFDFGAGELLVDSEYIESTFEGCDESQLEHQEYESSEVQRETEKEAESINTTPYIPGKYKLDLIPGEFMTNSKTMIRCCQIGGKPVNVNIADKLLDLLDAAKKSGIKITVNSGFRPGYGKSISTKSEGGVSVSADSQEVLYNRFLKNGSPDTAKPGSSKHGSGIAVDLSTGTRTGAKGISTMSDSSSKVYTWLVKNSWKFGFVRAVGTEEWHYEYWPDQAKNGPYARIKKSNKLYYSDLGINNLQGPNWGSSIT
jgi:LAS superfamily LD-carboxypeptidase LdcB